MDAQRIDRLEQLLERELSTEEEERLRRIKNTLGIKDNDGIWDVLVAMEYQRKYYDELPEKISRAAAEIFSGLASAAEKEVALAQGRLAESVLEQAKNLSLKTHVHIWVMWGILALILLLRMPVGILIGTLCFGCGIFLGALAAKDFSEGNIAWRKRLLVALICFLPGGWVFNLTIF